MTFFFKIYSWRIWDTRLFLFLTLGRLKLKPFMLSKRINPGHRWSSCSPGADNRDGKTTNTEPIKMSPPTPRRWDINQVQLGKGKGKYNGVSTYCVLTVHWKFPKGHSSPPVSVATNSTASCTRQTTGSSSQTEYKREFWAWDCLERACTPHLQARQSSSL